jgi:hypothetical protein
VVWGERVGSTPILATTEASSVGCRCWLGAGSAVWGERVCSAPILATTEASSGGVPVLAGGGEAWGERDAPHRACLGGSRDLSTTESLRPACSPPSLPRWKQGSVNYRASAPYPLPTELVSVEAGICPLRSGVPEGRVACRCWPVLERRGESGMLPAELASVEAGICELQ